MMELYNGFVEINNCKHIFSYSNFKFIISLEQNSENTVSHKEIETIVESGWIHVIDVSSKNELIIRVERLEYLSQNKYCYHSIGHIIINHLYDIGSVQNNFTCDSLTFTNDIIDFFLCENENFLDETIYLLNKYKGNNNIEIKPDKVKDCKIKIDNKEYNLSFSVKCMYIEENAFPLKIFKTLCIKSTESGIVLSDMWNIITAVMDFLRFISKTININLGEIYIDCEKNKSIYEKYIEIKDNTVENVPKRQVIKYNNIKDGISNIFNQIEKNQICFRSLYNYSTNTIFTYDIVNICAAFDNQCDYEENVKNEKQHDVKKKMLKKLNEIETDLSQDEYDLYNGLLECFKNCKDTLKQRLETTIHELEKLFDNEEKVKWIFGKNYKDLPTRMKNARNNLAHGKTKYTFNEEVVYDMHLLRAMIYMLILRKSNISKTDIIECLKTIGFPVSFM